jgi:DNA-directed RNA polymerase specialized sigma subunit
MSNQLDNEKKITNAIESLPQMQWYKIEDIAQKSGLSIPEIYEVMNASDDFVSSTDDHMQPVVTTRDRFRKSEPFFRKIVGAFKNRID